MLVFLGDRYMLILSTYFILQGLVKVRHWQKVDLEVKNDNCGSAIVTTYAGIVKLS
jgi:hypothetical protein